MPFPLLAFRGFPALNIQEEVVIHAPFYSISIPTLEVQPPPKKWPTGAPSSPAIILPNPYTFIVPVPIFESRDDSLSLAFQQNFEHFSDEFDMPMEYITFNPSVIHYPKVDFSKKKDTTWIHLFTERNQEYIHPFKGAVTSRFGPRWSRWHYGTDIDLETGDSVGSAFDGVVRIAQRNSSYGYLIVVRHYNGLETYYAHLSKLLVEPEQIVKAGEIIALGGNTGRSRGSHLHFEVRYLGAPMDPENLIDFKNYTLKAESFPLCKNVFSYKSKSSSTSSSSARYHKVKSGETLSSIARKYRTSVSSIQKLNRMRGSNIRSGVNIRVR
ncbi:MAG: M23 family metallopeptidase [Bacteroidales bacterium]